MKKMRQKITSIFAMFLALFFVTLSCQCVYASAVKAEVPQKASSEMAMHCHSNESEAAKATSENSECCGKCQTEAAAVLTNTFVPDKELGSFAFLSFSVIRHEQLYVPQNYEVLFRGLDPPFLESYFVSTISLRGPPSI